MPKFFITPVYKMPRGGKSKKYGKRKRYARGRKFPRRTNRRFGTTLTNVSGLSPLPSRYITKMKYAQAVTLTGVGMQTYQWNLNSIFAPSRTGGPGSHQPHGFDQFAALYNRYRVFATRYVVTVATDTYNNHYAVLPSNSATPPITNVSEARENPRCHYAVQNPGGTLKVLTGKVNLPALTGRTKAQYMADDSYQSIVSLSPSEIMTLTVASQGLNDDTGVSMNHTINILLEYYVEFFDPISLDQS